jgi:hypothetical protein
MLQEAENLGFAEDYGSRRIPRTGRLTIKDLLERGAGNRRGVPRQGGVDALRQSRKRCICEEDHRSIIVLEALPSYVGEM